MKMKRREKKITRSVDLFSVAYAFYLSNLNVGP